VVLGEETFFEKQELVFRSGGVIDHGDEEPLEVDLDPGEQLGEWSGVELAVVVEGELAGMEVDFDQVRLAGISVEAGGAFDIDAEDDGEFVEQVAVDGVVAFPGVEVAEVQARNGDFQLIFVAGGEGDAVAGIFVAAFGVLVDVGGLDDGAVGRFEAVAGEGAGELIATGDIDLEADE
jgi:hypothetical protein